MGGTPDSVLRTTRTMWSVGKSSTPSQELMDLFFVGGYGKRIWTIMKDYEHIVQKTIRQSNNLFLIYLNVSQLCNCDKSSIRRNMNCFWLIWSPVGRVTQDVGSARVINSWKSKRLAITLTWYYFTGITAESLDSITLAARTWNMTTDLQFGDDSHSHIEHITFL